MIIWGIFSIVLLIIALNDFLFFRIEDENILFLIGLYVISWLFGVSGNNLLMSFFSASVAFALAFVMNQFNWIGGGDVKFLFPLVLFAENNLLDFIVVTSFSGLILAIIYILAGGKIFQIRVKILKKLRPLRKNQNKNRLLNIVLLSLNRIEESKLIREKIGGLKRKTFSWKSLLKQEIPYGIALSCGGLWVVLENLLARW